MNIFQKIKAIYNYSGLYKSEQDIVDAVWVSIAKLKFDMQCVQNGAFDSDISQRINLHANGLETVVRDARRNGGIFGRRVIEKNLCDDFLNTSRILAESDTYKQYYVQLAMRAISQAEKAEDNIIKANRHEKEYRCDLSAAIAEQVNNKYQRTNM